MFACLFPTACTDDKGVSDQIVLALPADMLRTVAATCRGLALAAAGIQPVMCKRPQLTYPDAIKLGHPALQWYWARDPSTSDCINGLAKHGHLHVLRWLWPRKSTRFEFRRVGAIAARSGHLDVLQWAHDRCGPKSPDVCDWAAWNGHLEVLQWARAAEYPWSPGTCSLAAQHGHLDVLQWARAR